VDLALAYQTMFRHLESNSSMPNVMAHISSLPPLPPLPEPPIFDAPYDAKLMAVLNGSSFPPTMPADAIYHAQLSVIQAILRDLKETSVNLSITLMVAWLLMVVMCGFLLIRIRRNRLRALQGDADAARRIVLPAFEPLLWILGGANLTFIVTYGVLLAASDYLTHQDRLTIELAVAVKQLNGLLVPMYMLQPSLSWRALRRAVVQTLLLSGYSIPVQQLLSVVATQDNQRICYWTLMAARSLVAIYLLYLVVRPPARASLWTFRLFCLYVVSMMLMIFSIAEAFHRGRIEAAKTIGWAITVYSMVLPVCVWCVLRADTEHWRGIGKRAVELQETFRRKNGKIDERVSSQGLHVLIEMHRKYIIDFAHLQLRDPISNGRGDDAGSAIVYRGFLHTKKIPVAIKVYMPTSFTEETVAEFSHEAALCGSLVHPNILKFHGLCVCPPNICLVAELCQASLRDVAQAQIARLRYRDPNLPVRRQQTLIDIGYMIDAARALAYLHSFSPPFMHRDIKPSNFLIDDEGTVKLTDFGASRTLAVRTNSGHQLHGGATSAKTTGATYSDQQLSAFGRNVLEIPGVVNSLATYTAQYMAPEVITAHHAGTAIYGEAADVFSLAVTMWDVLHPGKAKYPLGSSTKTTSTFGRTTYGHQRDSEVFELVMTGSRPPMDPLVHAGLRGLIEAAWQADPRKRPTAQALVASLETIQEETCATFALELMEELNERGRAGVHRSASTHRADQQTSFAGTQAVEKLRICDYVDSQSEAIRLGNVLMDCGFLHHTKHARSFEYASAQYVFDVDQIMSCQPMVMLESDHDDTGGAYSGGEAKSHETRGYIFQRQKIHQERRSTGSSFHGYTGVRARSGSQSSRVLMERRCACRKLGQRIETERTARRRFHRQFKLFTDENLLADDQQRISGPGAGDFATYQESPHRRGGRIARAASEAA
jgi:serine/threonine protein kinase